MCGLKKLHISTNNGKRQNIFKNKTINGSLCLNMPSCPRNWFKIALKMSLIKFWPIYKICARSNIVEMGQVQVRIIKTKENQFLIINCSPIQFRQLICFVYWTQHVTVSEFVLNLPWENKMDLLVMTSSLPGVDFAYRSDHLQL